MQSIKLAQPVNVSVKWPSVEKIVVLHTAGAQEAFSWHLV